MRSVEEMIGMTYYGVKKFNVYAHDYLIGENLTKEEVIVLLNERNLYSKVIDIMQGTLNHNNIYILLEENPLDIYNQWYSDLDASFIYVYENILLSIKKEVINFVYGVNTLNLDIRLKEILNNLQETKSVTALKEFTKLYVMLKEKKFIY